MHSATKSNPWKRVFKKVSDKKGPLYGETDYAKKTIKINRATHKTKGDHPSWVKKNPDGTANLLDTIVHEEMHKQHPKMKEKTVRKLTPKKVKKMSKKLKAKLYSKYKK